MKYIGVDLHKQYFVTTVMNEHGDILNKHRVSTNRESIRKYFNKISQDCSAKVAMEACYNWSYMYDQIEGLVDEIQLAHPLKTRLIAEARIKTDSIDSEILAHLLRADLRLCFNVSTSSFLVVEDYIGLFVYPFAKC